MIIDHEDLINPCNGLLYIFIEDFAMSKKLIIIFYTSQTNEAPVCYSISLSVYLNITVLMSKVPRSIAKTI